MAEMSMTNVKTEREKINVKRRLCDQAEHWTEFPDE